jgi:hypothetical protein
MPKSDSQKFETQKHVRLVDGPLDSGGLILHQWPPNGIIRFFRHNAEDDVIEFANYHLRVADGEFVAEYSHG